MEIKYKERQWEGGEQIEREGEEINGFFFFGGGGVGVCGKNYATWEV